MLSTSRRTSRASRRSTTRSRTAARLPELALLSSLLLAAVATVDGCSGDDSSAPNVDAADGAADVDPSTDANGQSDASADAPFVRGHDRLSQTGLYEDIATKKIAADVGAFEPAFVLWSDGAEKKRWVRLPPGTAIDTTDPDHWILPVGTQLWKEFSLGGKRLETRLVERVGASGKDADDYWLGAFLWRDDESDADFVKLGANDVRQTPHDVPSAETCWSCHIGEPGHALGFSALQLSHDRGGVDLAALRARGAIPASFAKATLPIPAVGWLHANCGHCHNINGASWPDTDMTLRWRYAEGALESSLLYTSTVGVATKSYKKDGITTRIEPGVPDESGVLHRMELRVDGGSMPPLATEIVDDAGISLVRAWIGSLPPRDAGTD